MESRIDKRIKIFVLLEATLGGTRRHVTDLLMNLDVRKYDITYGYSTLRADVNFYRDLEKIKLREIKVIPFKIYRNIHPLYDLLALFRLVKVIRRERFDIVHTHSSKAGFLGRLAAKIAIPSVVTIYTPNSMAFHISRIYKYVERLASLFTDVTIAVTDSERKEIVANRIIPPSKVVTINSGVECTELGKSSKLRDELKIGPEKVVIISIGRLTRQKDPMTFFKSAKKVIENGVEEAHFVWIGSGEIKPEVESYLGGNNMTGRCALIDWRMDIPDLLSGADIFILTSIYESFGYVTCEAMACGLPVIATDVVGTRDLVMHERTGYLFPVGRTEDLSKAVLLLINDEKLRRQLGENGRKRIKEMFWLPRMVQETQWLYDKTIN